MNNHETSRVQQAGIRSKRAGAAAFAGALAVAGAGIGLSNTGVINAQSAPALAESQVEVFVALEPVRVLDTRVGVGATQGQLGAGKSITVKIGGEKTIPAGATSVAVNTTIPRSATSESFFTIWPTGSPQPFTSVNNAEPGQAVPNFAIAKLGDNGSVNLFNERGSSDFVMDVVGYYVTLDQVDTVGGTLTSGSGAPDNSVGSNGDAYVDENTGTLYVKVNNVYVASGTPTADTDSIYGAYDNVVVDTQLADGDPVAFSTDEAVVGDDVTRTDADTFVAATAGTYEISYRVSTSTASLLGGVQVEVGGLPVGPDNTLQLAGTSLTDTLTVQADAGDTIELVDDTNVVPIGLLVAAGDSASITIELIAVS